MGSSSSNFNCFQPDSANSAEVTTGSTEAQNQSGNMNSDLLRNNIIKVHQLLLERNEAEAE